MSKTPKNHVRQYLNVKTKGGEFAEFTLNH
jgi:hypothetical protein